MAEPHPATTTAPTIARPAAGAPARPILAIARGAAAGDEHAITALYEQRFDLVFAAARRATRRDEHFCLDVVQETFLRVLRSGPSLRQLQDDAHVDRWLARVAQSAALDMMRAEFRRARRERGRVRPGESAADPSSLSAAIAALQRELESLSEADRDLLRLRASGMTLSGIAEHVGSTIGSINGRLRRITGGLARTRESQP